MEFAQKYVGPPFSLWDFSRYCSGLYLKKVVKALFGGFDGKEFHKIYRVLLIFLSSSFFRLGDLVSSVKLFQKFFILNLLSFGRRKGVFSHISRFLLKVWRN